jgi:hypothetical protein
MTDGFSPAAMNAKDGTEMIPEVGRRALSLFKLWRSGAQPQAKPQSAKKRPQAPRPKWYSVSVLPGKRCCQAVKAIARKRVLSAEAPRLPLPGCDLRTCECRYQHHTDRRATPRRGVDREALPRQYEGAERRASRRDRRRPDK